MAIIRPTPEGVIALYEVMISRAMMQEQKIATREVCGDGGARGEGPGEQAEIRFQAVRSGRNRPVVCHIEAVKSPQAPNWRVLALGAQESVVQLGIVDVAIGDIAFQLLNSRIRKVDHRAVSPIVGAGE